MRGWEWLLVWEFLESGSNGQRRGTTTGTWSGGTMATCWKYARGGYLYGSDYGTGIRKEQRAFLSRFNQEDILGRVCGRSSCEEQIV